MNYENILSSVECCKSLIVFDEDAILRMPDIVEATGKKSMIVVDENTIQLLSQKVINLLNITVLPASVKPSIEVANKFVNAIRGYELLLAVGSGTLNDICKYVTKQLNIEYILIPSAASMNGFTSAMSSMLNGSGYRVSICTKVPDRIYVDMSVIMDAPIRMTLGGFTDLICRTTVRADWLLSSLLGLSEYPYSIMNMVKPIIDELLEHYLGLISRDKCAFLLLMQGLLISGLAMTLYGSSMPASQGEHMIAHIMGDDDRLLHGEKVGVAMMTMVDIQERLLVQSKPPIFRQHTVTMRDLFDFFGDNVVVEYLHQFWAYKVKLDATLINAKLCEYWSSFRDEVMSDYLSSRTLIKIFNELTIPATPVALGWDKERYLKALKIVHVTRDRFTFLDLATTL